MLYAQIPRPLRSRLLTEMKVDLKLVGFSIKDAPTEETRYSKLAVVREYFRDQMQVGTVEAPDEYFEGVLPMRWGQLDGPEFVYFGATPAEKSILGLAGSMAHVIGIAGSSRTGRGSWGPAIYSVLEGDSGDDDPPAGAANSEQWEEDVLGGVAHAARMQRGPAESFSFLARRLLHSTFRGNSILLGTPIFVAHTAAEPPAPPTQLA
jgi:uncharacterized protein DUF7019